MKKLILIAAALCFLVGCAPSAKPMYYWNNYSSTLYELKRNPSEETLAQHKACLVKIIADSAENDVRVPPGVYCELGFIFMQEGKREEALKYFRLEEATYPESTVLVNRLITAAQIH